MSNNPVSLSPVPAVADGATRGPITQNVTASGDTTLVASAGAELSIIVTNVWLSNADAASILVSLREGGGGQDRWKGTLAASGGGYVAAFHPAWKLPPGTALVVNLGATGNVDANVQFHRE